ncbi:MAG: penicillin acylase family protein, partial [Gemmatimonadaceae bacterium]
MNAWADGLNFYLATHPDVKPRVITHFEPWMALTFSEGSIGGDIERVNLTQLASFYGHVPAPASVAPEHVPPREPSGSNGIAIAPKNTQDHHALLWINPHTSFYFRSELQMSSDEGLDAYGAVTWGQFFIYQGFNDRIGWMHTTSGVDDTDEYLETVTKKGDKYFYKVGNEERPLIAKKIAVPYKTATGMSQKEFTVYYTSFGPIVRKSPDGKWVAIRIMQEPVKALTQSYTRTKARDYRSFKQTMELHTNSSNNTIFASADGDIAYFHSNFIPRRDTSFDWTRPVDGSNPATEWHGVLSVDESPNLLNPASGWIYNSNNWPWSAAGPSSRKREDFPAYVETGRSESPRGVHAIRLLSDKKDFTLEGLRAAAYDSYMPSFAESIPKLVKAYDDLAASDPLKAKVAEQAKLLRAWDFRWGLTSVPTSLAVFYATELGRRGGDRRGGRGRGAAPPTEHDQVQALAAASDKLASDFGKWNTPWGDINRFQRLNDDIASNFDDAGQSIPVGFASAMWGSLASFGARAYPNTKKWYGTSGNSFVAVVEFGKDSVRARAVTAGGESGDVTSKHFDDQAER